MCYVVYDKYGDDTYEKRASRLYFGYVLFKAMILGLHGRVSIKDDVVLQDIDAASRVKR